MKVCEIFTRAIRWVPSIFVTGVIFWSYYAYVVELCIMTVEVTWERILYMTLYHPLLAMFIWAYWQTVFTEPASPRSEYFLSRDEVHKVENALTDEERAQALKHAARCIQAQNRTFGGLHRYCHINKCIKPDRSHYCSVVKKVVLKMDHFCPWVNNTIGWSNYKFFILFLFYAFTYCLYVAATSLKIYTSAYPSDNFKAYFLKFWNNQLANGNRFHILFIFLVAAMFALSVSVLFFYHMYLTATNKTTLESFRAPVFHHGPDKNAYNLGTSRNFEEVFGTRRSHWLLPVFTSLGDGHVFPMSAKYTDAEAHYESTSTSDLTP